MNEISFVKIEEIEEIENNEDVYLMEVEENHNYFIDGVLSKNCQNTSRVEVRSLLSRCCNNVKVTVLGSSNQIDNFYLNKWNNGLNWIVKSFMGSPNYAHLVLKGNKSRGPITDLVIKSGL